MADSGPRFCPRCGTARVPGMAFCPNCGLDLRSAPPDETPTSRTASGMDEPTRLEPPGEPRPTPPAPQGAPPAYLPPPEPARGPALWPKLLPAVLLLIILALAVLYVGGLGPFGGKPGESGVPVPTGPTPFPTVAVPGATGTGAPTPNITPPPVGVTILSPADGALVGSADLTVIGTAPPGVRITQDISFGLDQHATADGTGHWAINVHLNEGENELKFRIGDDRSTEKRIHVTYQAPQGG